MTVPTSDNREQYLGNDSATEFDYAFKIFDADDLVVILTESDDTETTLVRGSDYSVDGVGEESGGTVTYPLSGDPLASGETLTILREIPVVQETDLRNQGAYYPETIEDELDRSRMIDQQQQEQLGRTLSRTRASDYFDAKGRRIADVGNAVEDQDAYTKGQADARFANDVITKTGGEWDAKGLHIKSLTTPAAPADNDAMNFMAVYKYFTSLESGELGDTSKVNTSTGQEQPLAEALDQRVIYVGSVDKLTEILPYNGAHYGITAYYPGWNVSMDPPTGGGNFVYDANFEKSKHNGGTVISSTVPWSASINDFLNGVGETEPSGTGCFVRTDPRYTFQEFGYKQSLTDGSLVVQKTVDAKIAESDNGRGEIPVLPGTYKFVGVTVPGSITFVGKNRQSCIFEPSSTGDMLTFSGQLFGAVHIRLSHNRAFPASAIVIDSPDIIKSPRFEWLYITGFDGAAIQSKSVLWETTFFEVHTRECGSSVNAVPAWDFWSPSTETEATNNLRFIACQCIFPRFVGMRIARVGDNKVRKIKFISCMIHGGTSDADLTPAPYDLVQLNNFSRCTAIANNITVIAPNKNGILAIGPSVADRSSVLQLAYNEIEGADANSGGIRCQAVADLEMGPNTFANCGSNYHVFTDSDCARVDLSGKQKVLGGLPFLINDNSPDETTGHINDERFRATELSAESAFVDKAIIGRGINNAENLTGEVSVSGTATVSVTLPNEEPNNSYFVFVSTNFNAGGAYATGKTTTGFTINFPTTGTGVAWWFLVRT